MTDVSYLHAWELWSHGTLARDARLWGIPMFWWGRIGKAVQLLGAFAVVAELLGPERLRRIAATLSAARLAERANLVVSAIGNLVGAALQQRLVQIAFGLLVALALFSNTRPAGAPLSGFTGNVNSLAVNAIAGGLVLTVALLTLWAVLWLADVCVINPMAELLTRPGFATALQIGGLVLLAVGFHWDVLAG